MTDQHVHAFTDSNFDDEVLRSKTPVLVDFYADWCQPCRVLAPTVDELADSYDGTVKVGKVDVDTEQSVAQRYGIASIPTILVFRDGEIVNRFVGVTAKRELEASLDTLAA